MYFYTPVVFVDLFRSITGIKMKLGDLQEGTFKIEAVRLAKGCPEACAHCGAYEGDFDYQDLKVVESSRANVEACLTREVDVKSTQGSVRRRLVDLFNNYVTTDVNTEPLRGDAFLHFAQMVKSLSGGASRVVCVSHGLRTDENGSSNNKNHRLMRNRLNSVVDQMDDKDVFVLSMDFARGKGKIKTEVNLLSYVATLDALLPAIRKGSRVTVSLQGDDNPNLPDGSDNPLFRGRVYALFTEVKAKLKQKGWSDADIMKVHVDADRAMVVSGRATSIPGLDPANECPVIPDADFVEKALAKDHTLRGLLDCFTGEVFSQANNPGKSYNTTVGGKWEKLNGNSSSEAMPVSHVRTSLERRAEVA